MEKVKKIISNYSKELQLLISIISENTENTTNIDLIDWNKFISLAKRHHVFPYILSAISKNSVHFPKEINAKIKNINNEFTGRSLLLTAEMLRLQNNFKSNGIICLPIKGPALSFQLFKDYGKRHTLDLDFLIKLKDLELISSLLKAEGFKQIKPDFELSKKQKIVHYNIIHHNYFIKKNPAIMVEIHWKLITPASLFENGESLFFNSPKNDLNEIALTPELYMQYLIVHGAMHKWFKLFWLKDIDVFLRNNLIKDFDYMNQLTNIFGTERMVSQTMNLLEILFNTPIPKGIKYDKNKSSSIVLDALHAITTDPQKLHRRGNSRIKRFLYYLKLKKGFQHKLTCLKAPLTNYLDWKTLPLPDSLFFLYYPLRPFLWFWSVFVKKNMIS